MHQYLYIWTMSIFSFAETEYIFSTFVFEEFRTYYAGFHLLFSPINHFLQMNALRVSPIELGFFCRFIILPQPQNRNKKKMTICLKLLAGLRSGSRTFLGERSRSRTF